MSSSGSRRFALAGGVVIGRGRGRAERLLARHLEPAAKADADVLVVIDFVRDVAPEPGAVVVAGRRGRATVADGDPVTVRWAGALRTVRPLLVAGHLAARRRGAVLLQGAFVAWEGRAVVVIGPSGAGKTRCLLAAVDAGADPLAPDWSWVDAGSGLVWPLPQPIRVRPHHRSSPALIGVLPASHRRLLELGRHAPAGRVHVDVPLARLRHGTSAAPVPLAGIVVLTTSGNASSEGMAIDELRSCSGDALVGTDSTTLLGTLHRATPVLRVTAGADPAAVADAARALVAA